MGARKFGVGTTDARPGPAVAITNGRSRPAVAITDGHSRPAGPLMGARLWLGRLGWLVLIWALSVAALAVVATLLHMLMRAAGMR